MVHHERVRMPPRIWSNIRNSVHQIYALSFWVCHIRFPHDFINFHGIILQPELHVFFWNMSRGLPTHPNKHTILRSPQGSTSSEASDSDPSLRSDYEPVCALSSALLVPQLVAALQLILTKDISKRGMFHVSGLWKKHEIRLWYVIISVDNN